MRRADTAVTTAGKGFFTQFATFVNCRRGLAAVILASCASIASAGINTWTSVGPEGGEIRNLVITGGTPSAYANAWTKSFAWNDASQTWTLLPETYSDIAVDPTNPDRMIFASGRDVYASTDGGATRVRVTPARGVPADSTRRLSVDFSADGTTVYLLDLRTILTSTDLGATWSAPNSVPSSTHSSFGVFAFAIDPMDPRRAVASVGSQQVSITSDGGGTWTAATLPPAARTVRDHAFRPSAGPSQLWTAMSSGLWYTDDSGASWTLSPLTGDVRRVGIDPRNPSVIYAVVYEGAGYFIYRSDDGGARFSRVSSRMGSGDTHGLTFDPSVRERVFLADAYGVWVSEDAGATWSSRNRGLVATLVDGFTGSSDRTYFYVGGQIHSLESGASSTVALDPSPMHALLPEQATLQALHVDRATAGTTPRLFAGVGLRGMQRSLDGGQTWTQVADPLLNRPPGVLVNEIDAASNDPDLLLASTSNGLLRSVDGGEHWSTTVGGPASPDIVAFGHERIAYAADYYHVYSSIDGGLNWAIADAGITRVSLKSLVNLGVTAYASTLDTVSPSIFKTTNGGGSWTRLPFSATGNVALAADATGLYATHSQGVSRSIDGGNTWTEISGAPRASSPEGYNRDVHLDPGVRGRVLVATTHGGVQAYTIASDVFATAAGQPTVPPAAGARAPFQFTVTNRGPHAVTGVTLNVKVSGRALFKNQRCSAQTNADSSPEVVCTLGSLASGASEVVQLESSFETAGPIEITATAAANETELAVADNTVTHSASYNGPPAAADPPPARRNGGGGALSWGMLLALASVAARRRLKAASRSPHPNQL